MGLLPALRLRVALRHEKAVDVSSPACVTQLAEQEEQGVLPAGMCQLQEMPESCEA